MTALLECLSKRQATQQTSYQLSLNLFYQQHTRGTSDDKFISKIFNITGSQNQLSTCTGVVLSTTGTENNTHQNVNTNALNTHCKLRNLRSLCYSAHALTIQY